MNVLNLLGRALRYVRRHRLNLDYDPAQEVELRCGVPSDGPLPSGRAGRRSDWHTGARAQSARRRRQGALADDVGISMYLGTRGERGL